MNPNFQDFVQHSSAKYSIKKGTKKSTASTGADGWLTLVEDCSQTESSSTRIIFESDCALWNPGVTEISRTILTITELRSLQKEGLYCYGLKAWKRNYITAEGICLELIEDVPESGGQFCLVIES